MAKTKFNSIPEIIIHIQSLYVDPTRQPQTFVTNFNKNLFEFNINFEDFRQNFIDGSTLKNTLLDHYINNNRPLQNNIRNNILNLETINQQTEHLTKDFNNRIYPQLIADIAINCSFTREQIISCKDEYLLEQYLRLDTPNFSEYINIIKKLKRTQDQDTKNHTPVTNKTSNEEEVQKFERKQLAMMGKVKDHFIIKKMINSLTQAINTKDELFLRVFLIESRKKEFKDTDQESLAESIRQIDDLNINEDSKQRFKNLVKVYFLDKQIYKLKQAVHTRTRDNEDLRRFKNELNFDGSLNIDGLYTQAFVEQDALFDDDYRKIYLYDPTYPDSLMVKLSSLLQEQNNQQNVKITTPENIITYTKKGGAEETSYFSRKSKFPHQEHDEQGNVIKTTFRDNGLNGFNEIEPNKLNLLPILIGAHWVLMLVDLRDKENPTLCYIDPLAYETKATGKEKSDFDKAAECKIGITDLVKTFLREKYSITIEDKNEIDVFDNRYQPQTDSINCGPWVIHIIDRITKNLSDLLINKNYLHALLENEKTLASGPNRQENLNNILQKQRDMLVKSFTLEYIEYLYCFRNLWPELGITEEKDIETFLTRLVAQSPTLQSIERKAANLVATAKQKASRDQPEDLDLELALSLSAKHHQPESDFDLAVKKSMEAERTRAETAAASSNATTGISFEKRAAIVKKGSNITGTKDDQTYPGQTEAMINSMIGKLRATPQQSKVINPGSDTTASTAAAGAGAAATNKVSQTPLPTTLTPPASAPTTLTTSNTTVASTTNDDLEALDIIGLYHRIDDSSDKTNLIPEYKALRKNIENLIKDKGEESFTELLNLITSKQTDSANNILLAYNDVHNLIKYYFTVLLNSDQTKIKKAICDKYRDIDNPTNEKLINNNYTPEDIDGRIIITPVEYIKLLINIYRMTYFKKEKSSYYEANIFNSEIGTIQEDVISIKEQKNANLRENRELVDFLNAEKDKSTTTSTQSTTSTSNAGAAVATASIAPTSATSTVAESVTSTTSPSPQGAGTASSTTASTTDDNLDSMTPLNLLKHIDNHPENKDRCLEILKQKLEAIINSGTDLSNFMDLLREIEKDKTSTSQNDVDLVKYYFTVLDNSDNQQLKNAIYDRYKGSIHNDNFYGFFNEYLKENDGKEAAKIVLLFCLKCFKSEKEAFTFSNQMNINTLFQNVCGKIDQKTLVLGKNSLGDAILKNFLLQKENFEKDIADNTTANNSSSIGAAAATTKSISKRRVHFPDKFPEPKLYEIVPPEYDYNINSIISDDEEEEYEEGIKNTSTDIANLTIQGLSFASSQTMASAADSSITSTSAAKLTKEKLDFFAPVSEINSRPAPKIEALLVPTLTPPTTAATSNAGAAASTSSTTSTNPKTTIKRPEPRPSFATALPDLPPNPGTAATSSTPAPALANPANIIDKNQFIRDIIFDLLNNVNLTNPKAPNNLYNTAAKYVGQEEQIKATAAAIINIVRDYIFYEEIPRYFGNENTINQVLINLIQDPNAPTSQISFKHLLMQRLVDNLDRAGSLKDDKPTAPYPGIGATVTAVQLDKGDGRGLQIFYQVTSVIHGGPAFNVGLKEGEILSHIKNADGTKGDDLNNPEIIKGTFRQFTSKSINFVVLDKNLQEKNITSGRNLIDANALDEHRQPKPCVKNYKPQDFAITQVRAVTPGSLEDTYAKSLGANSPILDSTFFG